MPATTNLGTIGAGGAKAGQDELQAMLAERVKAALVAQQQADKQTEFDIQRKQLASQEDDRRLAREDRLAAQMDSGQREVANNAQQAVSQAGAGEDLTGLADSLKGNKYGIPVISAMKPEGTTASLPTIDMGHTGPTGDVAGTGAVRGPGVRMISPKAPPKPDALTPPQIWAKQSDPNTPILARFVPHPTVPGATMAVDQFNQPISEPLVPYVSQADQTAKDERAQKAKDAAAPVDVSSYVNHTMSGKAYVNLGDFQTPEARTKATQAAKSYTDEPVVAVPAPVHDALVASDTARASLDKMLVQIKSALPDDPSGRIISAPGNTLGKFFQTDAALGAFGSWRSAAIEAIQALSNKGGGLRLTKDMINMMLENDVPKITDDWATAQQRVKNLNALLDSKEDAVLTNDRRTMTVKGGVNDKTPPAANVKTALPPGLAARSGRGGGGD